MNATQHVARNTNGRSSAIDGRTPRHASYALSQRIRKRIEEAFSWLKTIGGREKPHETPSLPRHRIQRVLDWIHLAGFDEMDEVSGDGSAELFDDGTIEVEFAYHNGDEALLKASGRAIR